MSQSGAKKKKPFRSSSEATSVGKITTIADKSNESSQLETQSAAQLKSADRNSGIKGDFTLIDSTESDNNNNDDIQVDREAKGPANSTREKPVIDSADCLGIRVNEKGAPAAKLELNNNNILSSAASSPATMSIFNKMTSNSNNSNSQSISDNASDRNHSAAKSGSKSKKFSGGDGLKQQSSSSSSPSNATTCTQVSLSLNTIESASNSIDHKPQPAANHQDSFSNPIPSYTSIFMQQQQPPVAGAVASANQQQQRGASTTLSQPGAPAGSKTSPVAIRGPLRKQFAQTDIDEAVAMAGELAPRVTSSNKKLGAFNFRSTSKERHHDHYEDEEEDAVDSEQDSDDLDERSPFSRDERHQLQRPKKSSSPNSYKHQHYRTHRANINNNHNPRNMISFTGDSSCPPTFNQCQNGGYCHVDIPYPNRKLDWMLDTPGCAKCSCNSCHKKRKLILAESSYNRHHASNSPLTCNEPHLSRTRTMQLILKSIILILLTLLLSMIIIGALLAGHYLPAALDRAINATRSFNVTIAG